MSEVFEQASVSLILADFAVADQLGKLQMVGGGLQLIGRDHTTGVSAAFALVVSLTFPAELFNEQYAFEVVLERVNGTPVELEESAAGPGARVMRFGQPVRSNAAVAGQDRWRNPSGMDRGVLRPGAAGRAGAGVI